MTKVHTVKEWGVIRQIDEWEVGLKDNSSLDKLYLNKNEFNELFDFVLENQDENEESKSVFKAYKKTKRKREIKVKNYVGVVETNSGLQLEILPKIYDGILDRDVEIMKTKSIFLKMLKRLRNSPFRLISEAHIHSQAHFPILQIFIDAYLKEFEKIMLKGIDRDYIRTSDDIGVIRGKLNISENIKSHLFNKTKFNCSFDLFTENIGLNKIIKSTLIKLLSVTKTNQRYSKIKRYLSFLTNVNESENIIYDFNSFNLRKKSHLRYRQILDWSKVILSNEGFSNFSGRVKNISLLFPMERVFEDYISYLFKRFSTGFRIKTQDKSYFLIEKHRNTKKFRLIPDIVANKDEIDQIILDTKWKIIDQNMERKNYLIKQSDMYQLYAYGKKYSTDQVEPKLVMLYPKTNYFNKKLDKFVYEGDLVLEIIPFNFENNERDEINHILNCIGSEEMYYN